MKTKMTFGTIWKTLKDGTKDMTMTDIMDTAISILTKTAAIITTTHPEVVAKVQNKAPTCSTKKIQAEKTINGNASRWDGKSV